jgi:hypothetical protein
MFINIIITYGPGVFSVEEEEGAAEASVARAPLLKNGHRQLLLVGRKHLRTTYRKRNNKTTRVNKERIQLQDQITNKRQRKPSETSPEGSSTSTTDH